MYKLIAASLAAAALLSGCTPAEVQLAQIAADERLAAAQAQTAAAAQAQAQAAQAQAAAQIAYAQAQSASASATQAAITGATMPVIVLIVVLGLIVVLAMILAFLLLVGWRAGSRRPAEARQQIVYMLPYAGDDYQAAYVLPQSGRAALPAPAPAPAWPAVQPAGRAQYIE